MPFINTLRTIFSAQLHIVVEKVYTPKGKIIAISRNKSIRKSTYTLQTFFMAGHKNSLSSVSEVISNIYSSLATFFGTLENKSLILQRFVA